MKAHISSILEYMKILSAIKEETFEASKYQDKNLDDLSLLELSSLPKLEPFLVYACRKNSVKAVYSLLDQCTVKPNVFYNNEHILQIIYKCGNRTNVVLLFEKILESMLSGRYLIPDNTLRFFESLEDTLGVKLCDMCLKYTKKLNEVTNIDLKFQHVDLNNLASINLDEFEDIQLLLYYACKKGNVAAVKILLDEYAVEPNIIYNNIHILEIIYQSESINARRKLFSEILKSMYKHNCGIPQKTAKFFSELQDPLGKELSSICSLYTERVNPKLQHNGQCIAADDIKSDAAVNILSDEEKKHLMSYFVVLRRKMREFVDMIKGNLMNVTTMKQVLYSILDNRNILLRISMQERTDLLSLYTDGNLQTCFPSDSIFYADGNEKRFTVFYYEFENYFRYLKSWESYVPADLKGTINDFEDKFDFSPNYTKDFIFVRTSSSRTIEPNGGEEKHDKNVTKKLRCTQ